MKKWTTMVIMNKRAIVRKKLQEKLFILHPTFQKMILKHRKYCHEIEQLQFVDISRQMNILPLNTFAAN